MSLERISNILKEGGYSLEEKKGVFLSVFDDNKKLLFSGGVLDTDQDLKTLLNKFLSRAPKGKYYVVDVVKNIIELNSPSDIKNVDVKKEGVAIFSDKEDKLGAILPNTEGVADIKGAISYIIKKEGIGSKKVIIYKFTTDRFVI